jgi:uncharacterized protein YkwD
MIMERTINDLRTSNGRSNAHFNVQKAEHCFFHCLEMARRNEVYHAEPHYLDGWSEAVGMADFNGDYENSCRHLIFEGFAKSEPHRNIILNSSELAVGWFTSNYKLFVTIRGR